MQNAEGTLRRRVERPATSLLLSAFCILPSAFLPACASAPPRPSASDNAAIARLRSDVLDSTRLPGVARGNWGIVVHSLERDERLVDINGRSLFVPASVAKLVSAATAADAVGWQFRFETTLRAAGPVVDGVLRGDLLVVGAGDPSIGGRGGPDLSGFIAAVKAAGIRHIDGRVVGDDDAMEEPRPQLSWAWDDLGYTTGAIFGALNLAENRTSVTVSPGAGDMAPAQLSVSGASAFRPLLNRAVTSPAGSALLLWPEQRPGEPYLTVAGTIPAGHAPVTLGISAGNPTAWFAIALRSRLLDEGVSVAGGAADVDDVMPPPDRASATVLYRHQSPTLAEIARPLLKDSVNVYGEALLRLNVAPGVFPTNDAALEGLRTRLTGWGVPEDSYQLVDGSGLSRRDAIAPQAVLTILRRMFDPGGASPFMTALPVAGVDGSLETRMRDTPAAGRVRAKTGTMSNIRSLAGYVSTRGGENLAFVILVNNFEGTGAQATRAVDAVAVRLAEFTR